MSQELDEQAIRNIKELMADSFPDVVEKYIENSETRIEQIREGFSCNNCGLVSASAHPLKSSSATLGIFPLSAIAEKIEFMANDACKNGRDMGKIGPLLNDLKSTFANVKKKLLAEIQR